MRTRLPACAVECHSWKGETFIAIGMYQIHEKLGTREGCVSVLKMNDEAEPANGRVCPLPALGGQVSSLSFPRGGVLDLKWSPEATNGGGPGMPGPFLACALAEATVGIYALRSSACDAGLHLAPMAFGAVDGGGIAPTVSSPLCLSVDWLRPIMSASCAAISSSQSNGVASAWRFGQGRGDGRGLGPAFSAASDMELMNCWQAHDKYDRSTEIWTSAWDRHLGGPVLYTGADDGLLKCWDLRIIGPRARPKAMFTNTEHSAGVCRYVLECQDPTAVSVPHRRVSNY